MKVYEFKVRLSSAYRDPISGILSRGILDAIRKSVAENSKEVDEDYVTVEIDPASVESVYDSGAKGPGRPRKFMPRGPKAPRPDDGSKGLKRRTKIKSPRTRFEIEINPGMPDAMKFGGPGECSRSVVYDVVNHVGPGRIAGLGEVNGRWIGVRKIRRSERPEMWELELPLDKAPSAEELYVLALHGDTYRLKEWIVKVLSKLGVGFQVIGPVTMEKKEDLS